MKYLAYTPELFDRFLQPSALIPERSPLRHREFVNYYYARSKRCGLQLAVDDDEELCGIQGVEEMRFADGADRFVLGCGSNFKALKGGAGAYLFYQWMIGCDGAVGWSFTEEARQLFERARWSLYDGIPDVKVNKQHRCEAADGFVRRFAKIILNRVRPGVRLTHLAARCSTECSAIKVCEEDGYTEELLAFESGFGFRFDPDIDHLAWRFNLNLPFAKYRLFSVRAGDDTIRGYVVLQESSRRIVVAQSDAVDPITLAAGILLSIGQLARNEADRREVVCVASPPQLRVVLLKAGFEEDRCQPGRLALGRRNGASRPRSDRTTWHINMGWGNGELQPPYFDARGVRE